MQRRLLLAAAVLLAILAAAGVLIVPSLDDGVRAQGHPALSAQPLGTAPDALAPAQPEALPAAQPVVASAATAPDTPGPAHVALWSYEEPEEGQVVRYTRRGRFGGSMSLHRSSCGSRRAAIPYPQLRIEFENGAPVVGAEMRGADGAQLAETDAKGVAKRTGATFRDYRDAEWYWRGRRLWVRGPRYAKKRGGKIPALVLWSGGRTVTGRLTDQHGTPVKHATITFSEYRHTWTATTDHTGSYAVVDCTPSRMRVKVAHDTVFPEVEEGKVAAGQPAATAITDLTAVRGTPLHVTVTDAAGGPLEGVKVRYPYRRLKGPDTGGRFHQTATTGEDGGVAILRVPGDDIRLSLSKSHRRCNYDLLGAKLPSRIALHLATGHSTIWVPVRCRDAKSGGDIEPETILVRRVDQPWSLARSRKRATTEATCHPEKGADFRVLDIRDLPKGEWELYFFQPGFEPAVVRGHSTEHGIYPPLDVQLRPASTEVTVTVLAGADGTPLKAAQVEARPATGESYFIHPRVQRPVQRCDKQGVATFHLPPGRWTFHAGRTGYEPAQVASILTGAGPEALALGLAPRVKK